MVVMVSPALAVVGATRPAPLSTTTATWICPETARPPMEKPEAAGM